MAICPTCAPRQKLKTHYPLLQPILSHKPWSYVGIDLIGPLAETPRGNRHVRTAADLFSKWTEAVPIPDATSRSVVWGLEQMIYRHGAMEKILTDNGKCFNSEV